MFRAQQNVFDDVVVKATDENLTSENWELIMTVVDKVAESPTGSKDAVAAMIKRLAHRNANVQLYTLELANALSQNCGNKMHRELASRSLTEALLRLAGDRNTHVQVKAKILERMDEWTRMFKGDADLGIMEGAYMRLKTMNPSLQAPSKPQKQQLSDQDKRREDEELQMALQLSMKENTSKAAAAAAGAAAAVAGPASGSKSPAQGSSSQPQPQQQPAPSQQGTTAATVSRVRALFDFTPSEAGELAFRKGDIIAVLESVYKDWWKGSLKGATGIFPLNYVEKLQDPTPQELEREAQMESEVFNQIGNVEKLLALLSTRDGDVRENDEITELYHGTLAIRPKLIELIGKYSQKKDDMTQLNERFIKARRDYEALLEASMSNPPQHTYGRPPPQQQYAYNAPPPSQAGYGGPPPQAAGYDARYHSPPPSQQQIPQNGPQPFYFVPPNQQDPPRASSVTHPAPAASTDDLYTHPGAGPRRDSNLNDPRRQTIAFGPGQHQTGIPQELATGSFDSPVSQHNPHNLPPQQGQQYDAYAVQPGKANAPSDPYSQPQAQQDGYTVGAGRPPVPTGGLASLPSQQAGLASPVYGAGAGTGAANSPYAAGGQYTAYNPSAVSLAGAPAGGYPRAASAAGGDESFYR